MVEKIAIKIMVGLMLLLTLLFSILGLTDVTNWVWYWYFAPIWIPIGILALLGVMFGIILFMIKLICEILGMDSII